MWSVVSDPCCTIVFSLKTLTCRQSFELKTGVKFHYYPINMNQVNVFTTILYVEPVYNGIRRTKDPRLMVVNPLERNSR